MTRVSIEEYPVTVPGGEPSHHRLEPGCGPTTIASGPDSALWFTEWNGNLVGSVTTCGVIETYDHRVPVIWISMATARDRRLRHQRQERNHS